MEATDDHTPVPNAQQTVSVQPTSTTGISIAFVAGYPQVSDVTWNEFQLTFKLNEPGRVVQVVPTRFG